MPSTLPRLFLAAVAACGALALLQMQPYAKHPVHAATAPTAPERYTPTYTSSGDLVPPAHYREWIYLTTGLDMSYSPNSNPDMHMFDNVFVNPEAYRSFLATGTWPDKTVFVLESRHAGSKGSINQSGHFQTVPVAGMEIHVKDTNRFPGGWAFFDVQSDTRATLFPQKADCYSCHAAHAAVDTTFVQFYPTLLPIAQSKGTLSAKFQQELAAEGKK